MIDVTWPARREDGTIMKGVREGLDPDPLRVTVLPRESVQDVCPICLRPVIVRNCEVIFVSAMCRWRLIDSCSGG